LLASIIQQSRDDSYMDQRGEQIFIYNFYVFVRMAAAERWTTAIILKISM
jgi:hypothetical protein